jgi:Ni/Co efflux regulator RcnB
MRRLMMSAAALAFLTVPALAQPGTDRGDRTHRTAPDTVQAAPATPPQQPSSPINRGHNPDQRAAPAAQPQAVAPVAQPQAAAQNRGDRDRGNFQGRNGQSGNFNRSDNRPNNNYQGNLQGNAPNNNFGNRGADNRNRNYGGQRRDYSGFRDFHRSFNASRRYRAPAYRRPTGWYDHRWTFGEFLPSLFWAPNYWLSDYSRYGLPTPPYGAVWVREGRDALMIDRDSGEIITVAYDVFY